MDNKNISIERYLALKKIDSKQRPKQVESNDNDNETNMDIDNENKYNNINFTNSNKI